MLDADLAELYGVPTSRMNEAFKRHSIRFPVDFMFWLSAEEYTSLISQIAISKPGRRGGRRKLPYVFTKQGVAMLSSVLNVNREGFTPKVGQYCMPFNIPNQDLHPFGESTRNMLTCGGKRDGI